LEKKRNNRLQFALSTLVLSVLLLASAAMTWWNCEPWRPAFAIPVSFRDERIAFSEDDKYLYSYDGSYYLEPGFKPTLGTRLYDARTGNLLHAWTPAPMLESAAWHCEWGYFYITGGAAQKLCGLWRIDTAEDLLKSHTALANVEFHTLLGEGQFALIKDNSAANLKIVRFPSLELFCDTGIQRPNPKSLAVAPDKDQLALACGAKITLYSLSKGKAPRTLDAEGCAAELLFSPDSRKLAYSSIGANSTNAVSIRIIDLDNPSVVRSFTSGTWHIHFTTDSSRLIYSHPAPLQLLLYDFKMDSTTVLQENLSVTSTKLAGNTLYSFEAQTAWDVRTAKYVYAYYPNAIPPTRETEHDRYILRSDAHDFDKSFRILDVESNESTGTLRACRWPSQFPYGIQSIKFAHHTDAFITAMVNTDGTGVFTVWRRGVPNRWWGFTTMPEFWLTLALAILFIWNICRRRRSPLP